MKLLDDDLFVEDVDDTEASDGLGEEDEDLLKRLEKKAVEIEVEADDPKDIPK
jgi:hypothetical protein